MKQIQLPAVNLSYGMYALDAGESIHHHLLAPGAPRIHSGALSIESSVILVVASGDTRLVVPWVLEPTGILCLF